jgi:hypothetical protein
MTNWNKEIEDLKQIINQFEVKDASSLEAFRIAFLGTKGKLKDVMQLMKEIPNEDKKSFGQAVNDLKSFTESLFENYKTNISSNVGQKSSNIDFWATATKQNLGVRHPISLVRNELQLIKEMLPLWKRYCDGFVFMLDRNTDETEQYLQSVKHEYNILEVLNSNVSETDLSIETNMRQRLFDAGRKYSNKI